jgi:hypothetical protein
MVNNRLACGIGLFDCFRITEMSFIFWDNLPKNMAIKSSCLCLSEGLRCIYNSYQLSSQFSVLQAQDRLCLVPHQLCSQVIHSLTTRATCWLCPFLQAGDNSYDIHMFVFNLKAAYQNYRLLIFRSLNSKKSQWEKQYTGHHNTDRDTDQRSIS